MDATPHSSPPKYTEALYRDPYLCLKTLIKKRKTRENDNSHCSPVSLLCAKHLQIKYCQTHSTEKQKVSNSPSATASRWQGKASNLSLCLQHVHFPMLSCNKVGFSKGPVGMPVSQHGILAGHRGRVPGQTNL